MTTNMIEWKWSTTVYPNVKSMIINNKNPTKDVDDTFNVTPNKNILLRGNREEVDQKMSEREMLPQCRVNPFSTTTYGDDVVSRDNFMKGTHMVEPNTT